MSQYPIALDVSAGADGQFLKRTSAAQVATANIADGVTGGVLTLTAALSGNVSLTLPTASGSLATNPMTTLGDLTYGGASGAATSLAGNTTVTKKFLTQTGDAVNSAAPAWGTISSGDVSGLTAWATKAYPADASGYLSNDGAGNISWAAVTVTPAGANTQIQYNNSGALGASANLTWDGSKLSTLAVGCTTLTASSTVSMTGGQYLYLRGDASTGGSIRLSSQSGGTATLEYNDGLGGWATAYLPALYTGPGGSLNQVQYNSGSALAGSAGLTWDDASGGLTITRSLTAAAATPFTITHSLAATVASGAGYTARIAVTRAPTGTTSSLQYGVYISTTHTGSDASTMASGELLGGRFDAVNSRTAGSLSSVQALRANANTSAGGTTVTVTGINSRLTTGGTSTLAIGYDFGGSGSGTVTYMVGVRADLSGFSNVTNKCGIFVGAAANVAGNFGIYQADVAVVNYFGGSTGVGIAASATSFLTLAAGTTGVSSLRITHGSAPTAPVNGDVWTTTTGLYVHINGVTVGPFGIGTIGGSVASTQVAFGSGTNTVQGDASLTYSTTTGLSTTNRITIPSVWAATPGADVILFKPYITISTADVNSGVGNAKCIEGNIALLYTAASGSFGVSVANFIKAAGINVDASAAGGTIVVDSAAFIRTSGISVGGLAGLGAASITAAYGIAIETPFGAYSGGVITDAYGIWIGTSTASGGTITNLYGIYQEDTAAYNHFAGYTAIGGAVKSTTTVLNLPASGTGASSLRIAHGTAPTTPVNGDVWTTTAGFFVMINGATVTMGTIGGTIATDQIGYGTGTNTLSGSSTLTFTPTTGITLAPTAVSSGVQTAFRITGAANTNLTLSTEVQDVTFNLARTVQWATGALTTQRAVRIQAPTYAFVGASTITTAVTLAISGPPVAGTNATITTAVALDIESGVLRTAASATGGAGFRLPNGAAPTSPVSGDMWTTTTTLAVRLNANTLTLTSSGAFNLTIPATGTAALGTGTANQMARWTGTNTVAGATNLTLTTTTGSDLLVHNGGTSTATTSTNIASHSATYNAAMGASGIFNVLNVTLSETGTTSTAGTTFNAIFGQVTVGNSAGGAGNKFLSGIKGNATSLVQANNNYATYTLCGGNFNASFLTSSITTATGLAALYGSIINLSSTLTGASGAITVTSVVGLFVNPGTFSAAVASGQVITTYTGVYIGSPTLTNTTITTRYGIYQADAAATNYFAGSLTLVNSVKLNVTAVTSAAGTTVISATDHCVVVTGSSTQTLTLPAAATGRMLMIKNRSTSNVTVNRAGSDTIDGGTTRTIFPNTAIILVANGTDWAAW
jgi:hypothetical protein